MKKYNQDDPENIHYMASQNKEGPEDFFKKLSTFEPNNAKNYKDMYSLLTRKERMRAKREGKAERIAQGMAEGKAEGREEGIEEGIAKGMEKGKRGLLKKLLEKRINIALLAEATGMTPEALQNL